MKKLSKLVAFLLVLCLVLMTCASAFAQTRTAYCADCKRGTTQIRVRQDLDNGINYPCPGTCMHHTPGCIVTIHAYRVTWWCTVCQEDTYDDYTIEWFEHSSPACPDHQ